VEAEGEEEDDEDDGDDEEEDDRAGEGDDDVVRGGEGEDEADEEAGPTETERTLLLPLMVIGTLTWTGRGGVVRDLRLRLGGGARRCWRRLRARRSPFSSSTSSTAAAWSVTE
jgi:hypothetical protein